jgi:uncharacterized HhH-GPD family protein
MIHTFNESGTATGSLEVDDFLRDSPTAVLMGILFDQRIRAEVAFSGPYKLRQRLGHFEMDRIAAMDGDEFKREFVTPPAVHRFSNVMSIRTQEFARKLSDEYGGDAGQIWADAKDAAEIRNRVAAFPGFGPGKLTKLYPAMALFGHQLP